MHFGQNPHKAKGNRLPGWYKSTAADLGISVTQLALAWVLREPNLVAVITGASKPEQVLENSAASGISLDAPALNAIDTVLAGCY